MGALYCLSHISEGKKTFPFSGKWSTTCQWQPSIKKFPFVIEWGFFPPEVKLFNTVNLNPCLSLWWSYQFYCHFPQSVLILSLPETPVPIATATISDITSPSSRAWPVSDKHPAVHLRVVVSRARRPNHSRVPCPENQVIKELVRLQVGRRVKHPPEVCSHLLRDMHWKRLGK